MFRAKVYITTSSGSICLTSSPEPQWKDADTVLHALKDSTSNMSGGTIERHVMGIGWTICEKEPV